jgi:hypothetical protein
MRQLAYEPGQPNAVLDLTDEPPRYSEESRQPLLPFSLPKAPEDLEGPRPRQVGRVMDAPFRCPV